MANYSYTPGREGYPSVEDGISIQHILNTMLEKAWLIALCILVFAGMAVYYVWKSEVLYTAHSVIYVEQEEQSVINADGLKGEDLKTYKQTPLALKEIYASQNKMDKSAEMKKKYDALK